MGSSCVDRRRRRRPWPENMTANLNCHDSRNLLKYISKQQGREGEEKANATSAFQFMLRRRRSSLEQKMEHQV